MKLIGLLAGLCLSLFLPIHQRRVAKPCPAGSFASRVGSINCAKCPPNTYAPTTGQSICTPCAKGTTTNKRSGQSECVAITAA